MRFLSERIPVQFSTNKPQTSTLKNIFFRSLLKCGRCKYVRYCSKTCQVLKDHSFSLITLSFLCREGTGDFTKGSAEVLQEHSLTHQLHWLDWLCGAY